jgi:dipeptidyl aminopeptidase/acylaminoacyl peptidase
VSAAIDFLLSQPQVDSTIGIWGQSLGGAIALQALAYDKRIQFGVVESTFSELKTIVYDYSERMFGFSIPWVNDYALSRAGDLAGFNPKEVSPATSAKRITQPTFMVHGTEDNRISIAYGEENYNNLASVQKEFVRVEGAKHTNVWRVGGSAYVDRVFNFLHSLH